MISLPQANEVWGKVMFLHVSAILSGGLCMSLPVWLPGGLCLWSHVPFKGSLPGKSLSRGGLCRGTGRWVSRETPGIRKAGGTHPTGMLSC